MCMRVKRWLFSFAIPRGLAGPGKCDVSSAGSALWRRRQRFAAVLGRARGTGRDSDVPGCTRWSQHPLDMGAQHVAVHGAVVDERSGHAGRPACRRKRRFSSGCGGTPARQGSPQGAQSWPTGRARRWPDGDRLGCRTGRDGVHPCPPLKAFRPMRMSICCELPGTCRLPAQDVADAAAIRKKDRTPGHVHVTTP